MAASPEQQFLNLTRKTRPLEEREVRAAYDRLKPVSAEFLMGEWSGGSLDTGHSAHKLLQGMKWAGKTFRSVNDVDPIMVYNDAGERVWDERWGHAQVREVKYRGTVSAAMIYDNHPIIDVFKYVSDDMVVGEMDSKTLAEEGPYYFYLTKM